MSVKNQWKLLVGGLGARRPAASAARSPAREFLERSRLVSTIAFLGGLLWMDCCADEVVGIFQALGHVLGLPEAVLGGTIMCWAASVGDLVATLSVVRHGHLAMAITSSFAGPIFQLLCGLGVGMLCITARGAPVAMVMDLELHVMFGFSIIVLAYFCIAVPTWHRCLLNWCAQASARRCVLHSRPAPGALATAPWHPTSFLSSSIRCSGSSTLREALSGRPFLA